MKKFVFISITLLFVFTVLFIGGMRVFKILFGRNVAVDEPAYELLIPTGSTYDAVILQLREDKVIEDLDGFEWLSKRMKFPDKVKPGRYLLKQDMNNKDIIRKLKSGNQDPLKVYFSKYRRKQDLAQFISTKLETDSASLMKLLNDSAYLAPFGLTPENSVSLFLSDQYEFFWNTNAEKLIERMHREYTKYWNNSRLQRARERNLTPEEVITVASIVEEETNFDGEKPRIAGVYLNRIKKGMKLEADPTVKYAIGDFEIRRVLKRHLDFDSPYNTYVYKGLPPGPICIPSKITIEAVLNSESHDYLFFCASADFSGTHVFAKTYKEHLQNAKKFQRELSARKIYR